MSEELLDYAVDHMPESDAEQGFFDAHNVRRIKQCIAGRKQDAACGDDDYPWLFDIVCNQRSGAYALDYSNTPVLAYAFQATFHVQETTIS
jgi:hypothetical protein